MNRASNVYVITEREDRVLSFLLNNQKAIEIHCDARQEKNLLGSIYVGKVKNIAKNIGAAFVDLEPGLSCYLPLKDAAHAIYTKKGSSPGMQAGDELLVQVSRENIKTKLPAVTTNVTLHGKYLLLTAGNHQISVSSKVSASERERLLTFWKQYREKHPECPCEEPDEEGCSCGWLFRTNAAAATDEQLEKEIGNLSARYRTLIRQARYRTCYSCLMSPPPAWQKRLSDLYECEADRIITDSEELYGELQAYLTQYQPEDLPKLSLYHDELLALDKLYSLETQLSRALGERVWLNSGGYLVIQPMEALTVIDVNTGKYEGGKKKEETFLKINLEAASEIARQIRLRNLSGIIIVDFINMESEEARKRLMVSLDRELKKDPVRTTLVDMTKLNLVEITRMKKEKPLVESFWSDRKRTD
ncbi:MAG: ribonuclease E/G [Candidatus Choladocola sp.]|nr:ribonuclease E/G [Candidatus Choladocola sp.]